MAGCTSDERCWRSSDHHLLMTTVRLRLKRFTNANSTRTKYNVGLLRNKDTQSAFQISLPNRFQPLQELIEDDETDIETHWEHCKKLWHDTCEEVLGKKKTQHKEWIPADTIRKLETRRERKSVLNNSRTRAAKAKAQEEYTAVDREVKRSTIDDLARQAETAAGQGNLRNLFLVTKKLTGKFQQTDKPVKDKNGNPLTTTKEQLKQWAEHFRELLNRPTPDSPMTPWTSHPQRQNCPSAATNPQRQRSRRPSWLWGVGRLQDQMRYQQKPSKQTETAVNLLYSLFSIQEPMAKQIHWRKWGWIGHTLRRYPAPHAKPWPGTRRGREIEAGPATVGGDTLRQSWNSKGPTGPKWPEQRRTECDGEGSLMAYAPQGAINISNISQYARQE